MPTLPPLTTLVVNQRLTARPVVSSVLMQVTDQYRQDEPRAPSPVTLDNNPDPTRNTINAPKPTGPTYSYFSQQTLAKVDPKAKAVSITQGLDVFVEVPSAVSYSNNYAFTFHTHLQARKNPGTQGRQYIVSVSAEDADDGGDSSAVVLVPANAPSSVPKSK